MTPRTKKLIGLAVLPPALLLYFGAVVTLAERLPDRHTVKLVYFIVTGLAWAAPTIPFIRWMERNPRR
ncbi:MAG: DUF2842 domain-containing protein [Parvularculaceae bacterium]|nr:DUF2842 domain-containing protein [Parvularculaceae bacterium]